ncbi:MAG: hypothetical protein LBE89_05695 [Helicobacteraceae bacterium]|jgi:hypothetical protein|nr:hypothetical protein [Helicobacteraceae bacterium]
MRFFLMVVLIFAFFGCDQNERESIATRAPSTPSYDAEEQPSGDGAEEDGGSGGTSILEPVITSASGSTPPRYGIEPD